jgi:hypothetical protein
MDDLWDSGPIKSTTSRVTFTDGLRALRGKPPPGLPEDRTSDPGDEAQAAQCMLEELGRLTGLATFYLGETAVGRINESIAPTRASSNCGWC